MMVAIVGSRKYHKRKKIIGFVRSLSDNCSIVTGDAEGVDTLVFETAEERGMPCKVLVPNWSKYGKKAGPIRNTEIVRQCDVLVAFWDGVSTGTHDATKKARKAGKLLVVFQD